MFREMRRINQQLNAKECKKILIESKRAVLSLIGDNEYPYGIPINYVYNEKEKAFLLKNSEIHSIMLGN